MEALALIIQRLFYGFFSGCIVILFVVLNYYVLGVAGLLPGQLETIVANYASGNMPVLLFAITAILIGMMFEGLFEVCCEYFYRHYYKKNVYEPKEYGKMTLGLFLIWHIFRKVGVVEAGLSHHNKEEKEKSEKFKTSPIHTFMGDTKNYKATEALWECEKYIEYKHKGSGVTRYKELAFIMQLVGFSFLCNAIISFGLGIFVFFSQDVAANGFITPVLLFYVICFAVSALLYFFAVPMAMDFARRYIRDVGRWYKAIKMADEEQARRSKRKKPLFIKTRFI